MAVRRGGTNRGLEQLKKTSLVRTVTKLRAFSLLNTPCESPAKAAETKTVHQASLDNSYMGFKDNYGGDVAVQAFILNVLWRGGTRPGFRSNRFMAGT